MALIGCPECEGEVSELAEACPHCGYPVAKMINQELIEVTGIDRVRSARQQAAGQKLLRWADTYSVEPTDTETGPPGLSQSRRKIVLTGTAIVIVVLQLLILYWAIYN